MLPCVIHSPGGTVHCDAQWPTLPHLVQLIAGVAQLCDPVSYAGQVDPKSQAGLLLY